MAHDFRHLFTPLRLGPLVLKNRIFSTAHAEAMAEDGRPGVRLAAYHEAKARAGPGDDRRLDQRASVFSGFRMEHARESRRLDRAGLPRRRRPRAPPRVPHHEPAHAPGTTGAVRRRELARVARAVPDSGARAP